MNRVLITCLCIPMLFLHLAVVPGHARETGEQEAENVARAIELSTAYLATQIKRNGMFEYLDNMNPEVEDPAGYNILRHAGTIYALGMANQFRQDKFIPRAMVRAGQYLHIEAIGPVPGRNDMLAVWSRPEVNLYGDTLEAKLGGNGLGLVALLSIEQVAVGFTPLEALRKLGAFIVFMQKKNGDFYAKYAPAKGGYQTDFISLYYPGEAALGLLMLYERDPQEAWLRSAVAALTYLARSREGTTDIPPDHWALLATARLFQSAAEKLTPEGKELLLKHAVQIADSIADAQVESPDMPFLNGGFTPDGRTTPTATRLEGLLATLTFLPEDHPSFDRIEGTVDRGMDFLLKAQVKQGKYAGAFPRSVARLDPKMEGAEDFNQRATEIRVDYVQHALSAMIQYYDWLMAEAAE